MDSKLSNYKQILSSLQVFLEHHAEKKWAVRLGHWLTEFPLTKDADVIAHLERTRKALGGMGSIGDVVLCPENGHSISANEIEIEKANENLKAQITKLDKEIESLLKSV